MTKQQANFEISQTLKHFASFLFWLTIPSYKGAADMKDAARNHGWAVSPISEQDECHKVCGHVDCTPCSAWERGEVSE